MVFKNLAMALVLMPSLAVAHSLRSWRLFPDFRTNELIFASWCSVLIDITGFLC